jgi:hypothetical protein
MLSDGGLSMSPVVGEDRAEVSDKGNAEGAGEIALFSGEAGLKIDVVVSTIFFVVGLGGESVVTMVVLVKDWAVVNCDVSGEVFLVEALLGLSKTEAGVRESLGAVVTSTVRVLVRRVVTVTGNPGAEMIEVEVLQAVFVSFRNGGESSRASTTPYLVERA